MGKKILIVDDAMFMRKMIRKILMEGGYTDVEEAPDGETALELFEPFDPDLVLLDITMPGKSGLEVLEELLARRPQKGVHVLGRGPGVDGTAGIDAGRAGFHRKAVQAG